MSISVNNITKLYGLQKALDSVSLEIAPGGIVGLLGPNGAGKSTLMKILTCYLPPSDGTAKVCGFDVMEESMEVRKRVGYLPENNPLYLDLFVREFLEFVWGISHREGRGQRVEGRGQSGRNRISEIIDITGLSSEQHKKLGQLSKGYRQRAGLAQALLHDPEVLILDEPTSGLDPNQLAEIRSLIQDISREKTVLLSTHIMQEVEAICNRAIIIHKGKIVADYTTSNLRHLVAGRVIIRVEFDKVVEGKLLEAIPGAHNPTPAPLLQEGKGVGSRTWLLESPEGTDIRPAIFNFAVQHGLTVLSMNREEQKLEEVFQELTRG